MSKDFTKEDYLLVEDGENSYYQLKEEIAVPYRLAIKKQLDLWLEGISTYNEVNGEDTPDFSACDYTNLWPLDVRKRFVEGNEEVRMKLLLMGLTGVLN